MRAEVRPHALNVERNVWVNDSAVKRGPYQFGCKEVYLYLAYAPVHVAKPVIVSATIVSEALAALAMHALAEHV